MIKNGRHLLQELTVEDFVPNDTFISMEKNIALVTGLLRLVDFHESESVRTAIPTGPNMSGKSVYLKQIGLIVFLAHVGSYIPGERAIIGLTDKILTRINSLETGNPVTCFF